MLHETLNSHVLKFVQRPRDMFINEIAGSIDCHVSLIACHNLRRVSYHHDMGRRQGLCVQLRLVVDGRAREWGTPGLGMVRS